MIWLQTKYDTCFIESHYIAGLFNHTFKYFIISKHSGKQFVIFQNVKKCFCCCYYFRQIFDGTKRMLNLKYRLVFRESNMCLYPLHLNLNLTPLKLSPLKLGPLKLSPLKLSPLKLSIFDISPLNPKSLKLST